MAAERKPMYCLKCRQATYDAQYCDKCRCVFCPDSKEYCDCTKCETFFDLDGTSPFCNSKQLPYRSVCYYHFCPVCLTEHEHDDEELGRYCSGCYKFTHFHETNSCKSCGLNRSLSRNGNCIKCECLYCDNIHCIVHKCLLCNERISFNDPNLKYCEDHACQQCVYEPVAKGRFCAKCSVNRTVGTHTKRAN